MIIQKSIYLSILASLAMGLTGCAKPVAEYRDDYIKGDYGHEPAAPVTTVVHKTGCGCGG